MKHLINKLKEFQDNDFKVVVSRGTLAIQQTQRNKMKAELIQALYLDIKEECEKEGFDVYETSNGPILEFLNSKVENKIFGMAKNGEEGIYTGLISLQFDIIMKNLDINGAYEQEDFYQEREEKEKKRQKKEQEKKIKMKRDAEIRAEKERRREEEILRITSLKK